MRNITTYYAPPTGVNAMSQQAVNTTGFVSTLIIPVVLPRTKGLSKQASLPHVAGLLFSFANVRYEKSVKAILTGGYAILGGKLCGVSKQKSQQYHKTPSMPVQHSVSGLLKLKFSLKINGGCVYISLSKKLFARRGVCVYMPGVSTPGFFMASNVAVA